MKIIYYAVQIKETLILATFSQVRCGGVVYSMNARANGWRGRGVVDRELMNKSYFLIFHEIQLSAPPNFKIESTFTCSILF